MDAAVVGGDVASSPEVEGKALSLRKRVAFALVATLLCLLLIELGLRLAMREVGKATIPTADVRHHVEVGMAYDPELGWRFPLVPDPSVGINTHGFRYPETTLEKPAGTWRAFTFGDSQTYGAGVDANQTYSAFAERALKKAVGPEQDVQVIDAGISGYSALQVLRLIEKRILAFDPDALLVDCRTYDSPRDAPIGDEAHFGGAMARLMFRSRTVYAIAFLVDLLRPEEKRRMRADSLTKDEHPEAFYNHDLVMALGERHGVSVIFLTYPFWDVQDGRNQIVCLAPPAELPEGARVADICAALQASGLPPSELFQDNNHLTVRGNAVVGQALAEALLGLELGL